MTSISDQDQQPNRLAPFAGQSCTDNLVCRWVDFLFYRLDLRLDVDAQKRGQDYLDAGGGDFFSAAEVDTYDQVMAQFRGLKPELLTEMSRANRGTEEFNRRCESEPGYFESLCGLDEPGSLDIS